MEVQPTYLKLSDQSHLPTQPSAQLSSQLMWKQMSPHEEQKIESFQDRLFNIAPSLAIKLLVSTQPDTLSSQEAPTKLLS